MGFSSSNRLSRSRAFTMIEMLIVIGIILILISLFFVGFKYVVNSNRTQDTKAALQTAKTLFSAYAQASGLQKAVGPVSAPVTAWWTTGAATLPPTAPDGTIMSGGAVSSESLQLTVPGHPVPPSIVQNTEAVMLAMTAMPDNQKIMTNLPPAKVVTEQQRMGDPPGTTYPTMQQDSWGNPILFVPAYGLMGVKASGPDTYSGSVAYQRGNKVVYLGVIYTCIVPNTGTIPVISSNPTVWGGVCSPDFTPFWASAGPDGDLSKGDDNIYSFEQ
jgi:prepilin-type N-terminal cleavage/methylation domain-containing protein